MTPRAQQWLGLILLVSWLVSPLAARALPASEGPGLDLIVLVDRSTSMLGRESWARDRYQVGDLLDLTLDLLAWNAASNRVTHRLGVVSFGSAVRIDLSLARIRQDDLIRLRSRLAAVPFAVSLGNTDILAAFVAAARMFQSVPADQSRKRAILVLTDGIPNVAGRAGPDYSRELWQFVSANFAPAETTVEIVVFSKQENNNARRYARLWRDLSNGRVLEVTGDQKERLAALHRVVTRLVGTRVVASRPATAGDQRLETLVLPPYLDLVVFDILRGPRSAEVAVFAPDAFRPLTAEAQGVEQIRMGETLWTFVVRRPAPGLWTFRKSHADAHVKILSQQFFPRGVLVGPDAAKQLRQYDRVDVAYRIVDSNGRPLREIPGYPLSLEVSLRKPDGHRDALVLERQPAATFFKTRELTECGLAGRYWTEVLITTKDLADRRVEVFRDHWSGFSVAAASRIDCRVMAPQLGKPILRRRLLWAQPVATHLECRDRNAQPVELATIVRGSPTQLFRPSLSLEGRPTTADLELEYLGRGTFHGWLRGAGFPGFYRLQLGVDRSRLAGAYNIRLLPLDTIFVRTLSWPDVILTLVLAEAILVSAFRIGRATWKDSFAKALRRKGGHDVPRGADRFA
jgi:von Willebrand factor type A domain